MRMMIWEFSQNSKFLHKFAVDLINLLVSEKILKNWPQITKYIIA